MSGGVVQAKVTKGKEEKEDVESQKQKNVSWQPALEKDLVTAQQQDSRGNCRNPEDRQWNFKQR